MYFDQPQRAFGGLYRCTKFVWNRCSSFDNIQVLIFSEFGFKTPIHAPKMGFSGFDAIHGEKSLRYHRKEHPKVETCHMMYRLSKSVHQCGLSAMPRTK